MKSGVYAFFNKTDKKVYVGSSKDIITRKEKHLKDLRKKRHHNAALQYDWSNGDDFDFKIWLLSEYCSTISCVFPKTCTYAGPWPGNDGRTCARPHPPSCASHPRDHCHRLHVSGRWRSPVPHTRTSGQGPRSPRGCPLLPVAPAACH